MKNLYLIFFFICIFIWSCTSSIKLIENFEKIAYDNYGISYCIYPKDHWGQSKGEHTDHTWCLMSLVNDIPGRIYRPVIALYVTKQTISLEDMIVDSDGLEDFRMLKRNINGKNAIIKIGKFYSEETKRYFDMEFYRFYHRNHGIYLMYVYIETGTEFGDSCDKYFNKVLNSIRFY